MTNCPIPHSGGISVVIPVYRSAPTLALLCGELEASLRAITDTFEVVLVDDGSNDGSWPEIRRLAEQFPWIIGVTLLRNYGQHNALLAGIRMTSHDVIVTLDDDLQNPPSEIGKLLDSLTPDVDVVYGRPVDERQSWARNVASRVAKRSMSAALGEDVHPHASAFRVFRRELIQSADDANDPFTSVDVILSWATTRTVSRHVDHQPRSSGRSGYDLRKLVRHAVNMVTGYSTRPLRWVSLTGLGFAFLGFALLAFVLIRWLFSDASVAGFTFLGAAITLFSGVQLVSLGVIGEYIGRMHTRTMGKPAYLVRSTLGPNASSSTHSDK